MEKGTSSEPLCDIIDTSMEITMKKKKKKRNPPCEKEGEELNVVPSSIDPSILVPIAKDHRVNLDGVLDEGMLSKVEEWLANDLAPSGCDVHSTPLMAIPPTTMVEVVSSGVADALGGNVAAKGVLVEGYPPSKTKVRFSLERAHKKIVGKKRGMLNKEKKSKGHVIKLNEDSSSKTCTADGGADETIDTTACIEGSNAIAKLKGSVERTPTKIFEENAGTLYSANNLKESKTSLNVASSSKACTTDAAARATVSAAWNAGKTAAGIVPADCTAGNTVSASCTAGENVGVPRKSKCSMGGDNISPTIAGEMTQNGPQLPKTVKGGNKLEMNGKSNLNFAGLFKENRLQGNGFKLTLHEFINDEVVLDEVMKCRLWRLGATV